MISAEDDLRERAMLFESALRAICGPEDQGPWMVPYREAGGGYQGLRAIAETVLALYASDDKGGE